MFPAVETCLINLGRGTRLPVRVTFLPSANLGMQIARKNFLSTLKPLAEKHTIVGRVGIDLVQNKVGGGFFLARRALRSD